MLYRIIPGESSFPWLERLQRKTNSELGEDREKSVQNFRGIKEKISPRDPVKNSFLLEHAAILEMET